VVRHQNNRSGKPARVTAGQATYTARYLH